jgi:predicted class III extradiol MEMO1 family dioxygenase
VFSFPHTALDYSGPLQARVVSWLYEQGFKRVIALGVVHGALIPDYRVAMDKDAARAERSEAIRRLSGAFLPEARHVDTPFGALPLGAEILPAHACIRSDASNLLTREFSLDTFFAILRLAADVFHVDPLPILPLYVGFTRDPITGSFETAEILAEWLRDHWDEDTAIVTTGDIVHYGAVYGSEDLGSDLEQLEPAFRQHGDHLFENAFVKRDLEAAYRISLHALKSDQREILPVLVHLLGNDGLANIESFELSDYAAILETAPPCFVASALVAYQHQSTRA